MRIGINTLFFIPGEVGGSETYLCETLKALLALGGGHEVILFTSREGYKKLFLMIGKRAGVFFQSLEFSAANRYARILREQTQLPLAARRWRLDVLWSPGYTAPLFTPCPQVVSILDMQYKTHPQDLTFLARLTTNILVQTGARRARRVIAISEFSKAEVVRHTDISANKIDVTP
jgi:glycosyltransferase involved in cell wall biosynthesis